MTGEPERQACVIGWPIAHSRSPVIHRYWLDRYRIAGGYDRLPVKPEDLSGFFAMLREGVYVGCNVTVPHKVAVLEYVEVRDPVTARIGAVNTIYREGAALVGRSTDGSGFLASIRSAVAGWSAAGTTAVILGAGGAARSIAAALSDAGAARVTVLNRTFERAERLALDLGGSVRADEWGEASRHLGSADLLVNATSLGMAHNPPLCVPLAALKHGAIVTDIVYVPLETPLLREARARGHRVVDGLGMLLHQAAPGFELWFGVRPEVTPELREAVLRDLGRG